MDRTAAEAVGRDYQASRSRYQSASVALRALIEQLAGSLVEIDHVTSRAKEAVSVSEKLSRRDDYESLSDLTDLVGVRVVARYADDVKLICEALALEFDVREDVSHGGTRPDSFGYSSRHLICKLRKPRSELPEWANLSDLVFEIQVRSILQHAWASISHGLDYKSGAEVPEAVRRQLFRVAALLETGDELFGQFRAAVSGLRTSYAADVASANWRSLAVDLDSLIAAQDEFSFARLVETATGAGWLESAVHRGATQPEKNLGTLAILAQRAGLTTLGEVADYITELSKDSAILTEIADAVEEERGKPVAIGADIASMALLASGLLSEADVAESRFRGSLKTAIRSVRASRT